MLSFSSTGTIPGMLFGDSGYPTERWLMTPFKTPRTPAQRHYNRKLSSVRVKVEQSFGIVKRRFPCIALRMRLQPQKVIPVIMAVFVLHNIGIDMGDIVPPPRVEELPPPDPPRYVRHDIGGLAKRLAIVAQHCIPGG